MARRKMRTLTEAEQELMRLAGNAGGATAGDVPGVRRRRRRASPTGTALALVLALGLALGQRSQGQPTTQPATQPAVLPEEAEEFARLAKVLAAGKFPVAREAARALGKLKSPAAVDALIEALPRADAQTAMGIGMALGKLGNPKAIPALLSMFDRPDALEILATNPLNETLASVAHWSLVSITSDKKDALAGRRAGLAMIPGGRGSAINDRAALAAVRDAWRDKLAQGATQPATRAGEAGRIAGKVSDEHLAESAKQVRSAHAAGGLAMWNALAELVRPGMTVRQMQIVLPPKKAAPVLTLWNGQVFFLTYPLDDQFGVEASGVGVSSDAPGTRPASGERERMVDYEHMALTSKPRIKPYAATSTQPASRPTALPGAEAASTQAAGIDRLIEQLGHDDYRRRDAAQRELVEIGLPAAAALETAAKDKDAERATRARTILAEIDKAWGPAVKGIRLALRPAKAAFVIGEQIELDLLYRNVSDKPITVCTFPDTQ